MKKIAPLLIAIVLVSCSETPKSIKKEITSSFVELLKNDVKDDNINGSMSIAIIHKDSTLVIKSFGRADTNTIYRIGSITKSFTGFLMLQLQEDGILNINDPVEKYLPEIKTLVEYSKFSPITLKQLASHTSGLDRESRNRSINSGKVNEWEEKVLLGISETSFRSKPGERFRYSNIGYAILGLAISKAANKPYIKLVEDKIFKPLKMSNSFFVVPENKKQFLAKGIAGGPTAELNFDFPKREHNGRGYRIPNGGIYSTVSDLAKFVKACMGYSSLLKKESVELIQTTQTPSKRLRSNYSFGFDLYSAQAINTIGHRGSTPGYSAHIEFEKDSKYGVVLLRNYNFGNTNLDLRANALLRNLSLN